MKNKLFLLIICALLAYSPIYSSDQTKSKEQLLQEDLISLASNGQPYDDAILSNVANQVKQISVSFDLNNSNGMHNEALWKELVATVVNFYSKVINTDSKEAVFANMMECLNGLASKDSHGRINVLLGTNEMQHEDELENLEAAQ